MGNRKIWFRSISSVGEIKIPLEVKLGETNAPLSLPNWWKVFPDAESGKMGANDWAQIPESLPGKTGNVSGTYAAALNNTVAIDAVAGGYGERRSAVVYATIDSPTATKLPVAAYADFWMAWVVNGEKVYDGLKDGGGFLADHAFDLPLKAGRNVIAVQVQAGSQGWKLHYGGPAEREAAVNGKVIDAVRVTLKSGDTVLATQQYALPIAAPIPTLPADAATAPDALADWMKLAPLATLGEAEITNFFVKEPDTSRWYKGNDDLSARAWLLSGGDNLQMFVAVKDDKLVEAKSAAELDKSDALRVVLAGQTATLADARFGLSGGVTVSSERTAGITANVSRDDKAAITLYQLTIPRELVGATPFRLSLTVGDNDSNFLKQEARLGDADKPNQGLRLLAK